MRRVLAALSGAALLLAVGCGSNETTSAGGQDRPAGGPSGDMVLATTTSTQDSGLLDALVPSFEKGSECVVKTVAVGSGQAMEMGERGDADVLLVHSPDDEEQFMAEGNGVSRAAVMHNDFVIVGPPDDPAGLSQATDAADALSRIAQEKAPFASRGDDSGTHSKELELWEESGVDPSGSWYVETGQGMGETLTIANQQQAYTLTDRGTFLATDGLESEIVFEGSPDLRNDYHVIVVDHEGTNTGCAKEFSAWIREPSVQQRIGDFGVEEYGEQLFTPDASR
jgi:tungstate transport system substrate-binding protein